VSWTTSCEGCRFKRPEGVCADPAWPRLCYESPQSLVEGLALYLLEHEGTEAVL
jgi:hypothetical protein